MVDKITIGLPFNLDIGWMGGAYYLQNVLFALGTLPREKQPRIVVVTNDAASYAFLQESGYPHLHVASSEHVIRDRHHCGIDLLFAYSLPGMEARTLSWIPDFQERHLPYLFTEDEIAQRTAWHQECLQTAGVLLSSRSAQQDILSFYKPTQTPTFVVPFATFLPDERPLVSAIAERYDLPERYFFLPNQFWIHKNHVVVLAALRDLAARGIRPSVCLSGKEHDSRANGYGVHLRELAEQWNIADQLRFLGFMPRADQITVMDHAIAVLQPSRFEGWSTVIEDAKALGQNVIASNLPVHREQLGPDAELFDPSDHIGLAAMLEQAWARTPARRRVDYPGAQRRYGISLLNTFVALARANPLPPIDDSDVLEGVEDEIAMGAGGAGEQFLSFGWSNPEHSHVWSIGQVGEMWLPPLPGAHRVRFAVAGNPHVPGRHQRIALQLNGSPVAEAVAIDGSEIALSIDLDAPGWKAGERNAIAIAVDQAARPPAELEDSRLLGACLRRLNIDRRDGPMRPIGGAA